MEARMAKFTVNIDDKFKTPLGVLAEIEDKKLFEVVQEAIENHIKNKFENTEGQPIGEMNGYQLHVKKV